MTKSQSLKLQGRAIWPKIVQKGIRDDIAKRLRYNSPKRHISSLTSLWIANFNSSVIPAISHC